MIDTLVSHTFEESCYEDPLENAYPILDITLTSMSLKKRSTHY